MCNKLDALHIGRIFPDKGSSVTRLSTLNSICDGSDNVQVLVSSPHRSDGILAFRHSYDFTMHSAFLQGGFIQGRRHTITFLHKTYVD